MPTAAPRLDPRLVERLERLARGRATAAEIRRALVTYARELGVPAPSYEHVRRLTVIRRLEIEEAVSEVLPVVIKAAVGAEHGNEVLRVARGGRPRRS